MKILDNLIIVSLIVLAFIAGMKIAGSYYRNSALAIKDALERQYLRLLAKADADDPCRPYVANARWVPPAPPINTGDFDGDQPITPQFMEQLKQNGKAKTQFRKSDLAK